MAAGLDEERHQIAVGGNGERLAVRYTPGGDPERQPILYLHGFGSHQDGDKATHFRRRAVAAGHAFCSLDFRGHGESAGSLLHLSFSSLLDDVAAVRSFLAARGHRRLALVGSSLGGAVALWHAGSGGDAGAGDAAAVIAIAPAVGLLGSLERWAGVAGLTRWRHQGSIRFGNDLVAADLGWHLVEDLRRHDFTELAARHRTPSLIFQGQRDTSVRWQDVDAFAARCAPGTVALKLYPAGDHRMLDRMDEIWTESAKFLARVARMSR